uniref:CRAL-TRIO domain-containing protein n=1 Tax=Manihot esculenta TaxID=3983 RepID=A0A2C9U665_MANES
MPHSLVLVPILPVLSKESIPLSLFHLICYPDSTPLPQMEKTKEIAVTQMRKSIEKLGSSAESYGDITLIRFLIARSMDPEKAAKMFVQWQQWRAAFVPKGFIADSEVQDELDTKKIYLQKFVVHFLDKTIASSFKGREIGNEKSIVIIDLQQITYRNVDVRGLITGFQLLQAYYPERLAKLFILSMPWFFVSVWRMLSRFLEKATLEKIVIVSNEEERKKFIKEIGEESLPEEYGGQAKLVALQDFILPELED